MPKKTTTKKSRVQPPSEPKLVDAIGLRLAWQKYVRLFEQPPHGTEKQINALFELVTPIGKVK